MKFTSGFTSTFSAMAWTGNIDNDPTSLPAGNLHPFKASLKLCPSLSCYVWSHRNHLRGFKGKSPSRCSTPVTMPDIPGPLQAAMRGGGKLWHCPHITNTEAGNCPFIMLIEFANPFNPPFINTSSQNYACKNGFQRWPGMWYHARLGVVSGKLAWGTHCTHCWLSTSWPFMQWIIYLETLSLHLEECRWSRRGH